MSVFFSEKASGALGKAVFLAGLFFFVQPGAVQADQIILKSGELLSGKILRKTDKSYIFQLDSDKNEIEVPISKTSIVSQDPSDKDTPKGSVILFSETRSLKTVENTGDAEEVTNQAAPSGVQALPVYKSHFDVLKQAEDTVALSNARTAQVQKQLQELKEIADNANQIQPEAKSQ